MTIRVWPELVALIRAIIASRCCPIDTASGFVHAAINFKLIELLGFSGWYPKPVNRKTVSRVEEWKGEETLKGETKRLVAILAPPASASEWVSVAVWDFCRVFLAHPALVSKGSGKVGGDDRVFPFWAAESSRFPTFYQPQVPDEKISWVAGTGEPSCCDLHIRAFRSPLWPLDSPLALPHPIVLHEQSLVAAFKIKDDGNDDTVGPALHRCTKNAAMYVIGIPSSGLKRQSAQSLGLGFDRATEGALVKRPRQLSELDFFAGAAEWVGISLTQILDAAITAWRGQPRDFEELTKLVMRSWDEGDFKVHPRPGLHPRNRGAIFADFSVPGLMIFK